MVRLVLLLTALCSFLAAETTSVQISINSGNPAFPFPQFLPYTNPSATLGNLGDHNSVGVTHAEMERTIRDAYRIMMNRAVKPGGGVGGIDYVYYRSSPSCTEGDGYGLLGAVSMADKATFDGMWLWIHDYALNKVKRYSDCQESSPGYKYSQLPGWTNATGANSAADGDFDIAFALLCAYKQWGEFMGINDACGNPISYKQAAIDFLKALTDTIVFTTNGNTLSGDIGFDGYFKGGDSWQELTDWATSNARNLYKVEPESKGPTGQYFDYTAPSYFHQFAQFLTEQDPVANAWNINQFKRAEASSDWLMGQLLKNPSAIPYVGRVELGSNNVPVFTNLQASEDFRLGWRTILNYMWHGNPKSTWDPVSHQVIEGTANSYERDIGLRYARFLWDNRQEPWGNSCVPGADEKFTYWGPQVLWTKWNLDGTGGGFFFLNWIQAAGSPSAVASQDFNLMSEMFRQLEIEWDVETPGDGYLSSVPFYFHGWFRVLGLLTLTGNYHSPSSFIPAANMKVYMAINKTFAFEGDSITYTIDYRNYGSMDAAGVTIVDTLHKDFEFLSATGGGVFNILNNTVTWNLGTVPGFKTTTGVPPTAGQVKLIVKVRKASQKQYRNQATILCANGSGWTSNEYPNHISSVLERNYLDIAKRALIIEKTSSSPAVNPEQEIGFSINFENTSEAGWINGGRSGVHFSYSSSSSPSGPSNTMRARLFHDAQEAYVDYGNYRISYFLFDAGLTCYKSSTGCPTGWEVMPTIVEGLDKNFIKIFQENITAGEDSLGKWNQRIVVQFSDPLNPDRVENLATVDHHLREYAGMNQRIHRGGTFPLRLVWDLHSSNWTSVNWSDDWSYDPKATDTDGGIYHPITGDWTDPDNPDVPVNTWDPKACETASHSVNNLLVEEWDGYTWRRVYGNGPLPGRDAINVVITDTIPSGLTFVRFTGDPPLGIAPKINGNVITWTIPKLQIKEKGTISYVAKASGVCPMQDKQLMTRAWIWADKESSVSDSQSVLVTCDLIPPPPPPPTTMYKTADKSAFQAKDTVIYSIIYRQTHGNIVTSATDAANWIDRGSGKLSIASDGTITYDKPNTSMVYKYSFGVNGTVGGSLQPATYSEFALVFRHNGTDFVEMRMKQEYGDMWVKFYNNSTQIGDEQRFSYTGFPGAFNFKVQLSADTISLWAGDTSAMLPNARQNGIAIRAGYAGVKSRNDPGTVLKGYNSHLDAGFDIVIRDSLPEGIAFVSAGGSIITGALSGTQLSFVNSNGTIEWPVVSGDTRLDYGDSVSVWVKGLCQVCDKDTIINTAFSNLRGHPRNSIAAQSRTPCMEAPGLPDHLDIIVDTTDIDLRDDQIVGAVLMDAGTPAYKVYAVVRDINGNFIGRASSAVWSSSNNNIIEATGTAGFSWEGMITKAGSGSAMIIVNQSGLKPDSIMVNAEAAPPWPVIVSGIMEDDNGDLIPDLLVITLTDTFKVNQKLDIVSISYNGDTYNIPASATILQGVKLHVPFTSLSGVNGVPSGMATILMTVENSAKQSSRNFVDGVGPAITGAVLAESMTGSSDSLTITFSEPVNLQTIKGKCLQLIKFSTGDTVSLTITATNSINIQRAMIIVTGEKGMRPQEGDQLRIIPGELGGEIIDLNNNKAHLLNRPAIITAKPAQLTGGWYKDETGDGVIDAVYLKFFKPAMLNDILFTLSWGGAQRLNNLTSQSFSYGANTSIVKVSLPDSFKVGTGIKTSGTMFVMVNSISFPDLGWSAEVLDSAAPVISRAAIIPGMVTNEAAIANDTLEVLFSENVVITPQTNPFLLFQDAGVNYSITDLTILSSSQNSFRFLFHTVSGVEFPKSGDSIRINPSWTVKDTFGSWQNYPENRKVELVINTAKVNWIIKAGPNPFNASSGDSLHIWVKTAIPTRYKPDIKEVSIMIYDAIGNKILPNTLFSNSREGFVFAWNGRNKNGRKVGKGTYLGIVRIEEKEEKVSKEKILLGVK